MPKAPTADEREWLLSQLAALVVRCGHEPLVSAPLVLPTPEWFPDRWENSADGVAILMRRLLTYAGVSEPRIHIVDHTPLHAASTVEVPEVRFVEIGENGEFEVHLDVIGRPEDLLETLCHEAGHAYLTYAELDALHAAPFRASVAPPESEEVVQARASIASIYLGLGVPATNAAHRARHGGYVSVNLHVTEWAIATAGGLSAAAMAYLLAVATVVRGRGGELEAVEEHLSSNQSSDFRAWLEELEPTRDELTERLRLPEPATWPSLPGPPAADEPLGGGHRVDVPVSVDAAKHFNRGQPIFRVIHHRTTAHGFIGALAGAILGGVGSALFGSASFLLILGAGLVCGGIHGRRTRADECSDASCQRIIPAGRAECPGCGGWVAGELRNANQRLEALEALERKRPQS